MSSQSQFSQPLTALPASSSEDQQPTIPDSPTDAAAHDTSLSMTQSMLLSTSRSALPKDLSSALAHPSLIQIDDFKVSVRFIAIGAAPQLKQKVFKISASSKFGVVVGFLRKKLGIGAQGPAQSGTGDALRAGEGVYCYVNSVFAPGMDEGVGNLWRCFKIDDQLHVGYSTTPAFG